MTAFSGPKFELRSQSCWTIQPGTQLPITIPDESDNETCLISNFVAHLLNESKYEKLQ